MHLLENTAPTLTLSFTKDNLRDVFPHDNDHIVISIIMKSRRIHRILIDKGSYTFGRLLYLWEDR